MGTSWNPYCVFWAFLSWLNWENKIALTDEQMGRQTNPFNARAGCIHKRTALPWFSHNYSASWLGETLSSSSDPLKFVSFWYSDVFVVDTFTSWISRLIVLDQWESAASACLIHEQSRGQELWAWEYPRGPAQPVFQWDQVHFRASQANRIQRNRRGSQ